MSTFNQQNQKVTGNQYNAAGDINVSTSGSQSNVTGELNSLVSELDDLVSSGALTRKEAIDIRAKLEKAALEAEEPVPDKKGILQNLGEAKQLVSSFASAVGLVSSIAKAVELVTKIL